MNMAAAAQAGFEQPYVTQAGDAQRDRDEILSVWQDYFGPRHMQAAKFDHFYRDNPHGAGLIQLLRHEPGGELVGVIGAGPRPLLWQGRPIRGAVVAHFAMHPHHRTLGPALQLQRALVEAARGRVDLLYGLPRPNAIGVSRRVGFDTFGCLTRHAKVLRHAEYLKRRMPAPIARPAGALADIATQLPGRLAGIVSPRLNWRWSSSSDPRMDTLWRASAPADVLVSVRDQATLRWRFDHAPADRARYLLVCDRNDQLQAWFACDSSSAAGNAIAVMDYWSVDALTGIGRPLIRALCDAVRALNHSAIHLLLTTTDAALATWRAEGFVARSQQPVIGLWLNRTNPMRQPADVHITWADQDG